MSHGSSTGANVHISFVGQDDGTETGRELDGQPVAAINANLTPGIDLTQARRLAGEPRHRLHGRHQGRPIRHRRRRSRVAMLAAPNPDGRSNADVVRRG